MVMYLDCTKRMDRTETRMTMPRIHERAITAPNSGSIPRRYALWWLTKRGGCCVAACHPSHNRYVWLRAAGVLKFLGQ